MPCGPCSPVSPLGPCGPMSPVSPLSPFTPLATSAVVVPFLSVMVMVQPPSVCVTVAVGLKPSAPS